MPSQFCPYYIYFIIAFEKYINTPISTFVFGFFFLFELLLFSALLVSFALFAAIVALRQSLRVLCDASRVLIQQ